MELTKIFLVRKLTMYKGKIFPKTFFEKFAFHDLDKEPEP